MKRTARVLFACLSIILTAAAVETAFGQEVVVYSARKEHLIQPLFERYSRESGVAVRYITDKAPVLLHRIQAEGENSPADLLITVDAGNLWHAADEGVLQPADSSVLKANIPAHLRDPQDRWFGLSVRARTIVYSTERVDPGQLSTYENLAEPAWDGRLVLRTSKKVYNQSLVAMLIRQHGEEPTARVVSGWVDNLAAPPFSSDTKVMEAIAAGQGDVGIVNSYYFGRLVQKDPSIPLALFWPNQNSGGVHVNVSGAGVVSGAANREGAIALLEWLSEGTAQKMLAELNMEYPANPQVPVHPTVASWGSFRQNEINLKNAGVNQAAAIRLMDRAGYK